MTEHPELTEERRTRIVERCTSQLESMLAEAEGWYPDRAIASAQLKKDHSGYCDRLGELAFNMGYASFAELLHNEGFDIELDRRAAKHPVGHRIAPEDVVDTVVERVTAKLGNYVNKIDEWYPDRRVTDFAKNHTKTKENLNRQALALGYVSWAELLRDYGYEVPDQRSPRGGRPKSVDPFEIVTELERRYEGREPARGLAALREENPDLAGQFKSIMNNAKKTFGRTFAEELESRGVMTRARRGRPSGGQSSGKALPAKEETDSFLQHMQEMVAANENPPASLKELERLAKNAEGTVGLCLATIGSWSKEYYGMTPARLLKEKGLVSGRRAQSAAITINEEEFDRIVTSAKEKYAHAVRPRNATEFANANPEWKANGRSISQYFKSRGMGAPASFLAAEQLISKVVREDSIPRPSDEVLDEHHKSTAASALELQQGAPGSTITEFDSSVIGNELYGQPPAYEMLRVGDYVDINLSEDGYVHVGFCGHDLGLIGMDERIKYRLVSRLRYPREWGLVGGRVYARVTEVAGGQKKPRANLHAFFVEDESASTFENGLLISVDGKRVLDCADGLKGAIVIPEGIEAIADDAFSRRNIPSVKLPSTLRAIGRRAFYRTNIVRVTIPKGVVSIGAAAFTYRPPSAGESSLYDLGNAPVHFEVERGSERYESWDGSLVERIGDGRKLVSCYHKRPSGDSCTITVPDGITALGERFFETYPCVFRVRLKIPEGVVRMEAGCLGESYNTWANLPATLVDIDQFVWLELCGLDSGPYIDGVEEMPEGPIELDPPSRLRIVKGNPRYYVKGGYAYALPALPHEGDSTGMEGAARIDEGAVTDEDVDNLAFTYADEDGTAFAYSFKFPSGEGADSNSAREYLDWLQ